MNQFKEIHGDEPTGTPIEWNSQPPEVHFKSRISYPKISPMVSAILEIPNHHSVDNSYVDIFPSYYPLEYTSESVPDPGTIPIK